MRPFSSLGPVALAALAGLAATACGLVDVFRPAGLKDVVVLYTGPTSLTIGDRVAPAVTTEADGVQVSNPRLVFSSSDTTILGLTPVGDTLVGCGNGQALLTIRLISSMVTDTAPTGQASIRVSGGPPPPACP